MPREMAATALGAGGSSGTAVADPEPVAVEQELGGTEATQPEVTADPEGQTPPGSEEPGAKRLQDTPEFKQRQQAQDKALEDALSKLLPSAPNADVATSDVPRVSRAPMPPDLPIKVLPNGEQVLDIPLPITYQDLEEAFQANSDKTLDDRTAFHRAFGGLIEKYHNAFVRTVLPKVLPLVTHATTRQLARQSAQMRQVTQVRSQIETYWKSMAPSIPAKHIWVYAQEAAQAIPGKGQKAVLGQARYCLAKALEEFGDRFVGAQSDTDTTRVQDAMLRSGEGGGRSPGREAAPRTGTTMVDQMRATFKGVRGG